MQTGRNNIRTKKEVQKKLPQKRGDFKRDHHASFLLKE
jgi:hypothetical protein